MRRYAYRVSYRWNPKFAYFAGLMASDGCLVKDGRHIILTSKDITIVRLAEDITGKHPKLIIKTGQFGTTAFHFQFSDVAMYDFFLKAGITPAKSKTIQRVHVPDKFYRDFLRGLFDGDGTVYGFRDPRWRNSYMYYAAFISASKPFLEWLHEMNSKLFQVQLGRIKQGARAYQLVYAKSDSQRIYCGMYYRPDLPHLPRKQAKFQNFILSDPYVKITIDARVLEPVDRLA